MRNVKSFHSAYRELEEQLRRLAETEGDVFVPNPAPQGPVQYALICMEPSLGRWARSPDEAKSKVKAGFRNFLFSIEDFILHFCVRRYLCRSGERYHITDLAKGAMLVEQARSSQSERYDRWYPLLKEELDLVAAPGAGVITVGKVVSRYLKRKMFERPFTEVIHYSPLAGRARNADIEGREDRFRAFKDTVSLEDLIATAEDVFRSARVPARFREAALSRLARAQLTPSRKKLIFNYKVAFESMPS